MLGDDPRDQARSQPFSSGHEALEEILQTPIPMEGDGAAGWVRAARKALGLTQFQLAHQLGLSKSLVEKWEKGTLKPKKTYLILIVSFLRDRADSIAADLSNRARKISRIVERSRES